MRILVVGGTGTIGSAVSAALAARGHEVLRAGHTRGDLTVDIADPRSIAALYEAAGALDGVVCAAGVAKAGALEALTDEDFRESLASKLMGQVNLVRAGLGKVVEGGSFTLTSGDLSREPGPGTVALALCGAAVEAFARAAAIDLVSRYRVNVVSPAWLAESRVKAGLDPMPGIWARDLAAYYVELVEGDTTGRVVDAYRPKG
ncbi:MAG TPA: short chain dehydrogenase [Longimicrobiales bacterium]|nr:short chain dehydrogenase [Longimicrobiales bacterium]